MYPPEKPKPQALAGEANIELPVRTNQLAAHLRASQGQGFGSGLGAWGFLGFQNPKP